MKRFLGKKSDKSSGTDYDDNPYAQNQGFEAEDAYGRQPSFAPASTARPGASGLTGSRVGRNASAPSYPTPNAGPGYENGRVGAGGGYGGNPYGQYGQSQNPPNSQSSYSNRGPQGYGGMGANQTSDANGAHRDQLFSGARGAYAAAGSGQHGSTTLGNNPYGGYGAQRELTEEEKEEEVVQDINRQANDLRDDSLQITRRGVAMAYQMLEVGTGTGEKLDEQTHRFENMKSNLHTGNIQTRRAAQQTKHLQRVNGSMWNPANYIGKKERATQAQQHMEDGTLDLAQQEEIRKERYNNMQEIEQYKNSFARKGQLLGNSGSRAKNYNKFLLETDDVEQRDKEDELDANLDEMSFVLSKVKLVADANLKKVDKHIQTIGDITDISHTLEAKVRRVNNDLGTMK